MKVCIDYSSWQSEKDKYYSGGEYYTYQIIKGLKGEIKENYSLSVLMREGISLRNELEDDLFHDDDLEIIYINRLADVDLSDYDVLYLPLLRQRPDYVSELIGIRRRCEGLKIILTIHDIRTEDLAKWNPYGRYYSSRGMIGYLAGLYKKKIKMLINRLFFFPRLEEAADKIVTVSNYSMQRIRHYSRVKNITYIYQSIAYDEVSDVDEARERYILFVSAGREEKNFFRAVDAYAQAVIGHETEYKLYATGCDEAVKRYITDKWGHERTVTDNIVLLPFVEEHEMQKLYRQCAVLLFTSISEGFGLPVLNAGIYGRPVIASNCTSVPEVLESAALYVDPLSVESIRNGIKTLSDTDNYERYRKYSEQNVRILKERMKNGMRYMVDEILNI